MLFAKMSDKNAGDQPAKRSEGIVMKMRMFLAMLLLLAPPAVVFSQGPGKGPRLVPGVEGKGCSPIETFELSEAQRQAIEQVDANYRDRILRRWEDLTVKRHELQTALRDPGVAETVIRAKSVELTGIQNDIHQKMIEYQLETRKILLPDQIRRWCTWVGSPFFSK
jgi:Spy/CpxP family protein refolding chaperone